MQSQDCAKMQVCMQSRDCAKRQLNLIATGTYTKFVPRPSHPAFVACSAISRLRKFLNCAERKYCIPDVTEVLILSIALRTLDNPVSYLRTHCCSLFSVVQKPLPVCSVMLPTNYSSSKEGAWVHVPYMCELIALIITALSPHPDTHTQPKRVPPSTPSPVHAAADITAL